MKPTIDKDRYSLYRIIYQGEKLAFFARAYSSEFSTASEMFCHDDYLCSRRSGKKTND